MNGISLLVDTNILINLAEGKNELDAYLQDNLIYVSVISEMELTGHYGISQKEIKFFETLLLQCTIIELIRPVKKKSTPPSGRTLALPKTKPITP